MMTSVCKCKCSRRSLGITGQQFYCRTSLRMYLFNDDYCDGCFDYIDAGLWMDFSTESRVDVLQLLYRRPERDVLEKVAWLGEVAIFYWEKFPGWDKRISIEDSPIIYECAVSSPLNHGQVYHRRFYYASSGHKLNYQHCHWCCFRRQSHPRRVSGKG